MMITISRVKNTNVLAFAFLLMQTIPLFSQDSEEFARYLVNQKDYFRAITVYKRLLFESKENPLVYKYAAQIAEAYRLSGQYKSSIYFYAEALKNVSTPDEDAKALIGLGLNYYHLHTLPIAQNYFKQAAESDTTRKAELMLGLVEMEEMNWRQAQMIFKRVTESHNSSQISTLAASLSEKAVSGSKLPHKSPILAAMMSALLPGSGQVYAGHYFDGLQALAYAGAFSLATYSAYRYDRDVKDSDALLLLSASVTGIFYSANVLGAYQTARFRNVRIRQNFMNDVRSLILEVSF